MPMQWNKQAEAKLLSAIIQVYDVKITGAKLNEVAKLMGAECTAKGLTHRISKIRAKADFTESNPEEGRSVKNKTPKPTKGSGNATKKASKAGTANGVANTQSPGDDDEQYLTPPSTSRAKRTGNKRDYAGMNGEDSGDDGQGGLDKKIKIEVGEDLGEGLRKGSDDDD